MQRAVCAPGHHRPAGSGEKPGAVSHRRSALQPLPPQQAADDLAALVQAEGACVLNTAFARCWDVLRATRRRRDGFRVHLVGLGDVGGTVLQGLVLLGRDLTGIGIYDPNEAQCRRYCLEIPRCWGCRRWARRSAMCV